MAAIDYFPRVSVNWHFEVEHRDEILLKLYAMKSEILEAALWISGKRFSGNCMVTIWFDIQDGRIPYAVEVSIQPDRGTAVTLVDCLEDKEIGLVKITPLAMSSARERGYKMKVK